MKFDDTTNDNYRWKIYESGGKMYFSRWDNMAYAVKQELSADGESAPKARQECVS